MSRSKRHTLRTHDLVGRRRMHALRRARQRYGQYLTMADLDAISDMIRNGKGRCVEVKSRTVTIWDVTYNGVEMRVAYSKKWGMPLSFYEVYD